MCRECICVYVQYEKALDIGGADCRRAFSKLLFMVFVCIYVAYREYI